MSVTQEQLEYLAKLALADGHLPPEKCYRCGKPAAKLCDGIVSVALTWKTEDDDGIRTCDRPMCADHIARSDGPVFFCNTESSGERGKCEVDTSDYCEDCVARMVHGVQWKRHASKNQPLKLWKKGKLV